MICDRRHVCINQNVGGDVGMVPDFSWYMLLDPNIQSFGNSAYRIHFEATIKVNKKSYYDGVAERPFVRVLGSV